MEILTNTPLTAEQWALQQLGTNKQAKTQLTNALKKIIPDKAILDKINDAINDKYYEFYFAFLYEAGEVGNRRWRAALSTLMLKNENIVENYKRWQALATDAGTFSEQWTGSDTETQKNYPKTSTRTFTDNLIRQQETRYKGVGGTSSQAVADIVIDAPTQGNNSQQEVTRTEDEGDDTKTLTKGTKRTYSNGKTAAQLITENLAIQSPLVDFINMFGEILVNPFYKDELPKLWGYCEC